VDAAGNLYVADRDASVVRKIAVSGTISTVAGTGEPGSAGDGAQASGAQLNGRSQSPSMRRQPLHRGHREQRGPQSGVERRDHNGSGHG